MTLFSVGFKVDVKASSGVKIEFLDSDSKVVSSWGEAESIVGYFVLDTDAFVDDGTVIEYTIDAKRGAVTAPNRSTLTKLYTKYDSSKYMYSTDGALWHDLPSGGTTFALFDNSDDEERALFKAAGEGGSITYSASVTSTTPAKSYTGSKNSKGYHVISYYVLEGSDTKHEKVSPLKTDAKSFFLEGETEKFKVTEDVGKGYVFSNWKYGSETPSNTFEDSKPTCEITGHSVYYNEDLIAVYSYNPDARLEFTDEPLDGAFVVKGGKIERKFRFYGGYKGQNVKDITVGGTSVKSSLLIDDGESGTIIFTVPNSESITSNNLVVLMDDDRDFKLTLNVVDPTKFSLAVTPNDKTIKVGESVTYTPTLKYPGIESIDIDKNAFSYKLTGDNCVTDATKWTFVGSKVSSTGAKLTVSADFEVEGQTSKVHKEVGPYTIKVETAPLEFKSDVYVNEGLSIPLSQFLKYAGTAITKATPGGTYITVSPDNGLATSINITGKSATQAKTGGITVDGISKSVTVYPKPSIDKMERSGSGSSQKYSFTVTMPDKAYHGSVAGTDISKAKIKFVGKDGTYTMDAFDLKEDTSGYTKKNKSDVTIEVKKLIEVFNDICKEDKEEVEVYVYADGDESIISDKKTLKVYKIRLDGSAGADYKIMGESRSDKFYAIDGVSYEISSTPKSGYNGTPTKWDGVSFGTASSGSTSFSESKTVKAYYTGGSSSSSSSKSTALNSAATGDDYDDVPKTGESKADIWILWSVLFISILGAGFMIWKRFGLVKAIAEAEEEVAIAEREERIEAEAKEKQDKIDMLKNLRNL